MRKIDLLILIITVIFCACTEKQPADYPIKPVDFNKVKITDNFWRERIEINRTISIPKAFDQCETTGRIDNFALAGGLKRGEHKGDYPFDDTDVYKVIEGASYTLAVQYDEKLDRYLDSLIAIVAAGQESDGYLYTARTNHAERLRRWMGDHRWEKVNSHELYNCGHLYEAAVAHFKATGKRSLLNVAIKNADLIAKDFGPYEGQVHQPGGHPIVEMGLVKLYRVTGEIKYLELANYFIDEAGRGTDGRTLSEYSQDHKPVVEQDEAVGHAVRFGYFYSGITDVAAITQNEDYIKTLDRVWQNVTDKKLYITGGIGAREWGEGFGANYELPNMTSYCETCAAISNVYWNNRMFLLKGESKYIDVLERVLYNNILSGISLTGDHFFYDNPLESDGVHKRESWFGCACCPSNVTRFIPSIPGYIYAYDSDNIFINLFIGSESTVQVKDIGVKIILHSGFPWQGDVSIDVQPEKECEFTLCIRMPGWTADSPLPGDLYKFTDEPEKILKISLNGETIEPAQKRGYLKIKRVWKKKDRIKLNFPMEVRKIIANENVADDRGKFALQIGPVIYCAEGVDNNGSALNILLDKNEKFVYYYNADLLNGINVINGKGKKVVNDKMTEFTFNAVPYYAWCNRGQGEMSVWFPYNRGAVTRRVDHLGRDAVVTASYRGGYGPNDGFEPRNSHDKSKHYFYWWTRKGSEEWIEYAFPEPVKVSESRVYWLEYDHYDCNFRVPQSWELLYKDAAGNWQPVQTEDRFGVETDMFNIVKHQTVITSGLRINAQLQDGLGAGIIEWRVY